MITLSLHLISLGEEILPSCPCLMGLVKGWESVPEFGVSPVRGAKCGKNGYFLSNIYNQTPSRTSSLPWEISLNLNLEEDFWFVLSSDCNSQEVQRLP